MVFDLGGVLVHWNPRAVVASVFPDAELQERVMQGIYLHADWRAFDQGVLSVEEALVRFSARVRCEPEDIRRLFDAQVASLDPIEDSLALLEDLRAAGLRLFCLSNVNSEMFGMLRERYAFWPWFEGVMISGAVNLSKPDPAIFRHLLETYNLQAKESVFIDDHAANVRAAEGVGFRGIVFTSPRDCRRGLEELGVNLRPLAAGKSDK